MYSAGCKVVLYNVETNTQRFFREHMYDVLSITIHRGQNVAATADQGRFTIIYVFDLTTLQVKARLTGVLRRGVSSLAFDASGTRVLALGLDDANTLAVYDWAKGKCLGQQSTDGDGRVFRITGNRDAASCATYPFLTVGESHIAFWSMDEGSGKLTQKNAELGAFGDVQTFLTADSDAIGNFVGTQNGEVYCFAGTRLEKVLDAHHGPILALRINASGSLLITGGHDGYLSTWDIRRNFKRTSSTLFTSFSDQATLKHRPNSIRAVDLWTVNATSGKVRSAVATVAGMLTIVEPNGTTIRQVVQGHHGDLSRDDLYAELSGLASHPTLNRFISAGDFTVLLWDAETRGILARAALSARACCAAWSPDAKYIAIGKMDGSVDIYAGATLALAQTSLKCSNRRVACVRFSPDSSVLAVGTADKTIDVYDVTSGFIHGGTLTGAAGVVLAMDFSDSGQHLQAVTQVFELLFFDITTMQQINPRVDGVDLVRRRMQDVIWHTQTCTLGWSVQGIWPEGSQLDDVNHVCRSHDGAMLATAEESGLMKVFQCPCVGGGIDRVAGQLTRRPDSIRAHGHSAKVSQVAWLANDDRIISIGGSDLCCFQWKVVRQ